LLATTSAVRLIALVVPLGLDTLGVSFALGVIGLQARHRLRVALLFAGFEAAMPLLGVGLGAPLGRALGGAADLIAAALLLALGAYVLATAAGGSEREKLLTMTRHRFGGAVALGLSVSVDEFAIGFSAGLLRLPLVPLVVAVGAQAFLASQIGLRAGARVGDAAGELAERLAAVAMLALGALVSGASLAG